MGEPAYDSRPESRGSRALWGVLFAGVAFLHLYFVPYFPLLNNPNENSRVYQVRSVVELGKLSVDEQVAAYGGVNDLATKDGKLYTGKAPATTFLGVPVYAALRAVNKGLHRPPLTPFQLLYALRLTTAILPTLLFLVLFRRFLRRVTASGTVANALTVILGLGTILLSYAILFVNHSTSAASAFGALMAADAAVRSNRRFGSLGWLVLAGFLAGFCVPLDYSLAPVAAMLMGFAVWRVGWSWRAVVAVGSGVAVPAAMTAVYHQLCWGSPFRVSMSYLANTQFAANAKQGTFGLVGPTAASVWGLLFSATKGLLFFSPVLCLGLVAVVAAAAVSRRSKDAVLSFAVVLWMLVYGTSLINWDAGWTVGPRYVTVIVPFVVYALALLWVELGDAARRALLVLVCGLGMASVVAVVGASLMFPHLQPDFANPLFECVWPLWKDAITPHSVGHWLVGWRGRMDQAPVVIVVAVMLLYLVSVGASACRRGRFGWLKAFGGGMVVVLIAAGTIVVMQLPRTATPKTVEAGNAWLRGVVWEPKPLRPLLKR